MLKPSTPRTFNFCFVSYPDGISGEAKITEIKVTATTKTKAKRAATKLYKS